MGKFDYLLHSAKHGQEPPKRAPDKPLCVGRCRFLPIGQHRLLQCQRCGFIKLSDRC
jgi:hypothetical protein